MKRLILFLVIILSLLIACGCSGSKKEEEVKRTSTPNTTSKITSSPTITPEPTIETTATPKATIEPGKGIYTGSIKDESTGVDYNIEAKDGTDGPKTDFSLAVQFFATTEFNSITKSFQSSDGTLVITLYRWMGSFYETVHGKNVQIAAKQEYDNIAITGSTTRITTEFEPQPDGEYLIYITSKDLGQTITGWVRSDATDMHTNTYLGDEYTEGAAMSYVIHYTKTPENMYGPVQSQ